MREPVHNAIQAISGHVLPIIQSKLSGDEREAAKDIYPDYLEKRYRSFFETVLTRCGETGLERGVRAISEEEKEYWGGLRSGGVKRCLLPSAEYTAFCDKSQSLFERAILSNLSGVNLCSEGDYRDELDWIDSQIELLSGEEREWAENSAEEMKTDLDYIFGKTPDMSFRLCRFLVTGARKRTS